jgi:hypothetical protein
MTTNSDGWNRWRSELEAQLRRVYDALPQPAKTTYRKGDALKSFESFVGCFDRLMDRSKNRPRIMIAGGAAWEMWLHYSVEGEGRPKGEPLHIEIVSRHDEEDFGVLIERDSLMGYRDIIGETDYPVATVWRSYFGQ